MTVKLHHLSPERLSYTVGQPQTGQPDASGASGVASARDWASILSVTADDLVQEIGWDEDCDSSISESLEETTGESLLEEDTDEVVDAVLLWWRDEDGDLVDGLVDATRNLGDQGRIWLLTPAAGRSGSIEPGLVAESAQLAGLVQTKSERLGSWQGACLVGRGYKR